MARINIEDSLYIDIRFQDLIRLCNNDIEKALGAFARLLIIGQQYWKKDKSLIPKHVWSAQRLNNALIEVGLVEEKEHGFYVKGAEESFAWLFSRTKNGQKGGLANKKGSSNDFNNLDESIEKHSEAQGSTAKPHTHSHSHTQLNSINTLSGIYSSELEKPASSTKKTYKISDFQDFDKILSEQIKENLIQLYPDMDFLKREFVKMHNWLLANPKKNLKTKRGWAQFISNWLDSAWNKHQKNIATNPETRNTMAAADLENRISSIWGA